MYFERKNGQKSCRINKMAMSAEGQTLSGEASRCNTEISPDAPIVQDFNSIWNEERFLIARIPISVGKLTPEELKEFEKPNAPCVLDLPIKFPGTQYRLPKELKQFEAVIQKIIDFEAKINPDFLDEYYCYLSTDQGLVPAGTLQRPSPCHVDGFQGARWEPKLRINHSYLVSNSLPTVFFPQSFDFSELDPAKHNFYLEMDRQVEINPERVEWRGENGEILLIDAYTVHRGDTALIPTERTWLRLSFEVREFDRLGNSHNPMFDYNWKMVPRDVEPLGLTRYQPEEEIDASWSSPLSVPALQEI